ncbi:hypothetical protein BJF85_11390 [Saccharomonospora sp. CUA-673]|nr:hypothetical protein BJF85_11390 [Saccharomonospora sp. CUA-673]
MSIFGQVWVFSAIAFVLGAFLAWVFLVRPAKKQVRALETRLAAREADLRRISEPALGAPAARPGRNDPFSDADEALATGDVAVGGFDGQGFDGYDAFDGGYDAERRPEPETDWPERNSLAGVGGGDTSYLGADGRDDFDLADRPEDLEVPGERYDDESADERGAFEERGAVDERGAVEERGAFEERAFDSRGVFDDREDLPYEDRSEDDGFDEPGSEDATRFVAPVPGPTADSDPAPDSAPEPDATETTQLIGSDAQPHLAAVSDYEPPAEPAEPAATAESGDHGQAPEQSSDRPIGSGLTMGPPFTPVTSFEATKEFPVGGDRSGIDPSVEPEADVAAFEGFEGPAGSEAPESSDAFEDPGTFESEVRRDGPPQKRPGSLFEPGAVDTFAADSGGPAAGAEAADPDVEGATGDLGGADVPGGVPGGVAGDVSGDVPADPPAYAFGGGPAEGSDEDPNESTNILPKRTPRQRPPGGFDTPKPIQPSMRAIARREPDADVQSGSLFEPSSAGQGGGAPAAEPVFDDQTGQTGQVPAAGQATGDVQDERPEMTRFVTPTGQVPTNGRHGTQAADQEHGRDAAAAPDEQGGEPENLHAGPFGPGSAMPLPGGESPSPDFTVKASVTALRYVTDASPQYPRMVAEVWFRSPADAERVGFRPLT